MAPKASATVLPTPKALLFDFMGTCLDWRSGIYSAFQQSFDDATAMELASTWRLEYFKEVRRRTDQGLAPEDIDVVHRRVLDRLLADRGFTNQDCNEDSREKLVRQWHFQRAWPDMAPALARLQQFFEIVVHANGTTRLQIDLVKSSGLHFHALMSSAMLGISKPDHRNYLRGAELLKLKPEECLMVAAHAWDVQGAKEVGMQTAYIWRDTEDPDYDMEELKLQFNYFVDGRGGGSDAGLSKLADILLSHEKE